MLYGAVTPDWKPGQPLTPVGHLLFRSRRDAEDFAPGSSMVAVAVWFDCQGRLVRPRGSAARAVAGPWSSPAVDNPQGGLTVFGPIPPGLASPSAPIETVVDRRSRVHRKSASRPDLNVGFRGWDSLTMALLA